MKLAPQNFSLLETNILLNKLNNVTVHNCAVSNKMGTMTFLEKNANTSSSRLITHRRRDEIKSSIEVPIIALDDHTKEKYFDFIVMDIEGAEYLALQKMTRVLSKCRILVMEYKRSMVKKVSEAKIEDLMNLLLPHFNYITSIKKRKIYPIEDYHNLLKDFPKDESQDFIFSKDKDSLCM